MVLYFNINGGSSSISLTGTVTEILNDCTGTAFTLGTVIGSGTYNVYVSNDGGTTFVSKTEGTDYTISGQTLTFAVALTADIVKFEYTTG